MSGPVRPGAETPPRLLVAGATMTELIRAAGGWLFDRVLTGWQVSIALADPSDSGAVQICGVTMLEPHCAAAERPREVAAAANLCATEPWLGALLARPGTDVRLWGEGVPGDLEPDFGAAQHRLSVAALIFKAEALATLTHRTEPVEITERFRLRTAPRLGAAAAALMESLV